MIYDLNAPLKEMTKEEGFDLLCDYFLGDNYYIVDPVSQTQANAIIVDDIIRCYKSKYSNRTKENKEPSEFFKECMKYIMKNSK